MTRGQLARKAGVSTETIRFYERRGLIPEPKRLISGYRIYSDHELNRLLFIKNVQRLFFSLEEIRQLLLLLDSRNGSCRSVQKIIRNKIGEIEQNIQRQRNSRAFLERLAQNCRGNTKIESCPIVIGLEQSAVMRKKPGTGKKN